MTSSEERQPRPRRWPIWLALVLIVLFGLYSAGWFWAAHRVRAEADNAVLALNKKGIEATCANMQVNGFPLSFTVTCDNVAYEDDTNQVAASTGNLTAMASLTQPLAPVAELRGPLRTVAPGMTPLWIDWDHLSATAHMWYPLPQSLVFSSEGLNGQTDPADDADPKQLFSTATAEAQISPSGQDLAYTGNFTDLEIDADAVGGHALPVLNGSGAATVKNGIALLRDKPKSLRGQSVDIGNLTLWSGEARISVAGPVSVDQDGLIDASLTIKLTNPNAVAAALAAAIPDKASQIQQGFAALAMLGNEPTMPMKIVKGKASMGFIPLGKIKPLQ
jgi:hypothetical protein